MADVYFKQITEIRIWFSLSRSVARNTIALIGDGVFANLNNLERL